MKPSRGRARRDEASTPTYLVWELTLACDLGCKHCGSRAGKAREGELSTEKCLELVAQFAEAGIREITLIGGEAYLRDDWHIIAGAISEAGMRCGITTGARNLNQDRVDKAVAAGVHTIGISIDGLQHTHDMLRGPGSFEALLGAAARIKKTPIRLTTNSQINRLSLPELPALADRIVAMGSKAWQIAVTVPLGRAADRPELILQPYDLLELFPLLVWLKRNHLDPAGVRLFPANNVGYFGPYSAELRNGSHFGGCGAGRTTLGVEADGGLKACPSLPTADYTVGNLANPNSRRYRRMAVNLASLAAAQRTIFGATAPLATTRKNAWLAALGHHTPFLGALETTRTAYTGSLSWPKKAFGRVFAKSKLRRANRLTTAALNLCTSHLN